MHYIMLFLCRDSAGYNEFDSMRPQFYVDTDVSFNTCGH